ncbi:MGMT family protein [Pseudodesulfovibrio sediminis]|uniref:MGMT family protein n=1 Tax=Pseudodesulfovibrio sediminis TaxID=2810563 RepID=UPI001E587CCD|nr:MGMT family protein [Pseudodesulfovibrio sediminis]
MLPFTHSVVELIRSILRGTVSTYGSIAAMAGSSAARQVVRILHIYSKKESLPWHRVINKKGEISLSAFQGYEEQKALLESEGIIFDHNDKIDLQRFQWKPDITNCKPPTL